MIRIPCTRGYYPLFLAKCVCSLLSLMAIAFAAFNPRLSLSPFPSPSPLLSSASSSVPVLRIQRSVLSRSCLRGSSACLSSQALRTGGEELPDEDSVEFEKKDTDIHNKKKNTKKKKLRPSFCDQTLERWSVKISSCRSSFPWQNQKIQPSQGLSAPGTPVYRSIGNYGAADLDSRDQIKNFDEERRRTSLDLIVEKLGGSVVDKCSDSGVSDGSWERSVDEIPPNHGRSIPFRKRSISAPWDHGAEHGQKHIHSGFVNETLMKNFEFGEEDERHKGTSVDATRRGCLDQNKTSLNFGDNSGVSVKGGFHVLSTDKTSQTSSVGGASFRDYGVDLLEADTDPKVAFQLPIRDYDLNENGGKSRVSVIVDKLKDSMGSSAPKINVCASFDKSASKHGSNPGNNVVKLVSPVLLPWERETDSKEGEQLHRSNTELAERTIPEPELRRLRDAALRMKERMTVGPAGVTEAVVKSIHEKWKEAEVVKLRFEGTPSLNMKRTHEILENKTGGLVIWRSGRSVVLYRGMTYELPCIQTYSKLANTDSNCIPSIKDYFVHITGNPSEESFNISRRSAADSSTCGNPSEQFPDTSDIDNILDQLGPRYQDWSGRNPLPVDADLLPGVIPGYARPFRLLPYKTRSTLRDREMTALRRLARTMPPHFALGRNRQHQGLAAAIVKLWEKSSIAKIAIKRGIPNTSNERMAEEIKKLTGGVLVSRNKEYIVFYRGNDFVTSSVMEVLSEKQKLATIHQDEEEIARLRASTSIVAHVKSRKGQLVAGTLAETLEAKSRWGNPFSAEEREMLKKDMVLAKHASLVRYLERKLVFAESKVRKAEKALAKVQEFLKPADLPIDLETVSDEERALFRNIGLKMRGALLLGRRGVFDGTVENMHLNWKHRELVKILVKGKSFAQVKHYAISLEAESGGVLISLDKTTKGYAIIIYRGKNYQRPPTLRPKNLLTRRQALARSIELQRREALIHHISSLQEKIPILKSQLEQMEDDKGPGEKDLDLPVDLFSDDDVEDEGEEAYLETYSSGAEEDEDVYR
ncbi:CRM-domain containing factor CFM3, chloroplastic/mitochondrial-like [Musa acuminata AAA Group]|uniref:CRM-domain containing factor CFM3, chloroplastic/mitochondrial-like n=1 Tax=Musa acuminata AAA Group TaxID=214697 RepID=UPI0031E29BB0